MFFYRRYMLKICVKFCTNLKVDLSWTKIILPLQILPQTTPSLSFTLIIWLLEGLVCGLTGKGEGWFVAGSTYCYNNYRENRDNP